MASSNSLKYWELVTGGINGGIMYDASVSTAVATGLAYDLIEVRSAATFVTLSGWDYTNATGIDFIVDNGWSPEIAVGLLFAGKNRRFTALTLTGAAGQVLGMTKSNS